MSQRFSVISNYLISGPLSPDSNSVRIGMGIAAICFALGMISLFFLHRAQPLRSGSFVWNLATMARWGGGLILILLFLQNQDIEPFDMRVWPILVAFPLIGYLVYSLRIYRKSIPKNQAKNERHEKYEKYLPTAKRK